MKKASQEKARARRTPSTPQRSGKSVKPVVTPGALPETYEAKVLGQMRAVSESKKWTGDGNLLLADGTQFVFKPLVEPASGSRSRALHSVASLELTVDGWDENGLGEDRWLLDGENCLSRDAVNASAANEDPDAFRLLILRGKLQCLDDEASRSVCAVAWFVPSYSLKGQDEPVLLREFYEVQPVINAPPACPPIEKHEQKLSWWHDDDLTAAQGITADGQPFTVPISAALRELLLVLLETPGQPMQQKRLNERISKRRSTEDYRAAKILRSAEAAELFKYKVLRTHQAQGGKLVCLSVAPPVDPPTS